MLSRHNRLKYNSEKLELKRGSENIVGNVSIGELD